MGWDEYLIRCIIGNELVGEVYWAMQEVSQRSRRAQSDIDTGMLAGVQAAGAASPCSMQGDYAIFILDDILEGGAAFAAALRVVEAVSITGMEETDVGRKRRA